jgi:hypothetical protein
MNEAQLSRQQDMLRHFPTLLSRWAGAFARMSSLDPSCPRALLLEFTRPESRGCLRLACIAPSFIHGPTEWPNAHVTVALAPDGDGFIVSDAAANVSVSTGRVEISEHQDKTTNS